MMCRRPLMAALFMKAPPPGFQIRTIEKITEICKRMKIKKIHPRRKEFDGLKNTQISAGACITACVAGDHHQLDAGLD